MTDTLTFRYTVVEGDSTEKFDILDTRTTSRQKFSTALERPPAAEVCRMSLEPLQRTRAHFVVKSSASSAVGFVPGKGHRVCAA